MAGHRSRAVAYVLAAVLVAGLLWIATPGDRNYSSKPHAPLVNGDVEGDASQIIFRGTSDASAAIALDAQTLLVADDENNVLRAYRVEGGQPVFRFDLTGFLGLAGKFHEIDIEGAARIGSRVYWISSHGRNRSGKWRPNRCRFFATNVRVDSGRIRVRHSGNWCSELVKRMVDDPGVRRVCPGLAASYHHGKLSRSAREPLAPKERGLNIEGLCAAVEGDRLYIGFRNPLSEARAIIVPLLNPAEIIDKSAQPRFGRPLLWDLGGLGVRDMVRSARDSVIYVLAGPKASLGGFALYRWSGAVDKQPVLVRKLEPSKPSWRPEALVEIPNSSQLLILSDDGVVLVRVSGPGDCIKPEYYRYDGTSLNKHLRDETRKHFRGLPVTP